MKWLAVTSLLLLGACEGAPGTAGSGGVTGQAGARASAGSSGRSAGGARETSSAGADAGGAGGALDPDPVFTSSELAALAELAPASLPAPPTDVSNRFADDPAAAALGQKWFFDPGFSGPLLDSDDTGADGTLGVMGEAGRVACAGCHVPAAFADTRSPFRQISLAAGWGRRRAPSLLDVGQASLVMWDGRHDALYNQPFGAIEAAFEMNSSRLFVAEQVFSRYRAGYEALFGPMPPLDDAARFPLLDPAHAGCEALVSDANGASSGSGCHGRPGDAEFEALTAADQEAVNRIVVNVGKAIGAYERRLGCGAGRFDAWVHGQSDALSRSEQRGAALFVGKAGCTGCHSGPYLSDQRFHDVGLYPNKVGGFWIDSDDPGAATGIAAAVSDPLNVTGVYSDGNDGRLNLPTGALDGAFRTPTLRCVAQRPSFLHTGQYRALPDVVAFFDRGGDSTGYVGQSELRPLGLSALERTDLVAFLHALDGPGPAESLRAPPP